MELLKNFLLVGFFLPTLCFAQSTTIKDSIDLLIERESNDSLKMDQRIKYLSFGELATEEEIINYFNEVSSLNQVQKSVSQEIELILQTALQLEQKGSLQAQEFFNMVIDQAQKNNIPLYKAKALVSQSNSLRKEGKDNEALVRLAEAKNIYREENSNQGMASVMNLEATLLRINGQLDSSLYILNQVIDLIKEDSLNIELMSAHSLKGRVFRTQGNNKKAKESYLVAYNIALKNNSLTGQSTLLNNLGNIEHIAGQYDKAIEYYFNSLSIKEKMGNKKGLTIGYLNIGAIKFDMKDWDGALENFRRSDAIARSIDYKKLMVSVRHKIGNVFRETNQIDSALYHHQYATTLAQELNFKKGIVTGYYNLAEDYAANNKLSEASIKYLEALDLAEELGSKPYQAAILIGISRAYIKDTGNRIQGEVVQGDDFTIGNNDIESLLIRAKRLADEMQNMENRIEALDGLRLLYTKENQYRKNVVIMHEYISLKDSLFNQQKAEAISQWETKYETSKNEQEIQRLESENHISSLKQKQNKITMLGSSGFMILLFGMSFAGLKQRNEKKQAFEREIFRSNLSSNLHDEVGTILTGLAMQSELLANLVDENYKKTMEKLASMSREAMSRMRDTVWVIDSRKDKILDLKDRVLDFAEETLTPKNIKILYTDNFESQELNLSPEIRQNIYLIFKEALTNITKYSNASQAKINLEINNKNLRLTIQDNGVVQASNIKTSGTGLSNMKLRAENCGGRFSYNIEDGFRINVEIPI